jgi:hypothetical protein
MAPALAQRWSSLSESIERCADLMQSLEIEYGLHYESLNSVFLLWAWRLVAMEWLRTHGRYLTNMPRDFFVKQVDELFQTSAERWVLLSHWAGRWRASAGTTFENHLRDLAATWVDVQAVTSPDAVVVCLSTRLNGWLNDLRDAARKHIDDLAVENRGEVHRYFVPLWVWHRLDDVRWHQSRVQLRVGRKRVCLDVDHIVSCKWWEKNIDAVIEERSLAENGQDAAAPAAAGAQSDESIEVGSLNDIGNCFLLWTSFNVSKSDRPLKSFVSQIHEFKDSARLQAWQSALGVGQAQFDPDASDESTIRQAIAARTKSIKEELRKFIDGTHLPAHDKPAFDVSGRWHTKTEMPGEQDEEFDGDLAQTGELILGSYRKDGQIEGQLEGRGFEGRWSEPLHNGRVYGHFDERGRVFEGEWRYYRGRKTGKWRSERVGD